MRRIRILYIIDTYVGTNAGGSERHLYEVVSRLDPSLFDATIVQLANMVEIPYEAGHLDGKEHLKVIHWPIGRIYGLRGLMTVCRIQRLVGRERFDIIQSAHEKADMINALICGRKNKPSKISNRRDMGFKKNVKLKLLFRFLNQRFLLVIAPSMAILDALVKSENISRDQTRLISNGVDLNRFPMTSQTLRTRARERLGLSEDALVLGCVANLNAVKGHRYLLAAFEKVAQELPRAVLALVGDGELRGDLQAAAENTPCADRIHLFGQRADVSTIIYAFDVFVSTSLSEGLSNALIEAAASGLPIVATRVGGNSEVVRHGVNGYLVKSADVDSIHECTSRLLSDSGARKHMGVRSRELVEEEFSMNRMMDSYRQLYASAEAL
ncbi:MAG: glycosyltransferase [Gammaproteobacteria bacterium]|nr:glycosyltransferase [Gammaproteobacteria bacterium]